MRVLLPHAPGGLFVLLRRGWAEAVLHCSGAVLRVGRRGCRAAGLAAAQPRHGPAQSNGLQTRLRSIDFKSPCIGLGLPFTWTTDGCLPVRYSSGRAAPLLRLVEKYTETCSNVLRHKCCAKGFVPSMWDFKKLAPSIRVNWYIALRSIHPSGAVECGRYPCLASIQPVSVPNFCISQHHARDRRYCVHRASWQDAGAPRLTPGAASCRMSSH